MKGKGYRSNVAKGGLDRDRTSGGCGSCDMCSIFVMIYQTGIRLDDRGKSYTESVKGFRETGQQQRIRYSWSVCQQKRI